MLIWKMPKSGKNDYIIKIPVKKDIDKIEDIIQEIKKDVDMLEQFMCSNE